MNKFFTAVLIGITFNSQSHEFLTEMLVYPEDTISISADISYQVIDTFNLTENDLNNGYKKDLVKQEIKRIAAKKSRNVSPESVVCDDWDGVFKTCGVFDHFNQSRTMAIDICAGVAVGYTDLFPDGLIPQFLGPSSFIDGDTAAIDHHSNYNFSHGLSFNCVAVISNLATE